LTAVGDVGGTVVAGTVEVGTGFRTVVVGADRCGTVVDGTVFGTVTGVPIVNEATVAGGCCAEG
jgi:hypothetical protein